MEAVMQMNLKPIINQWYRHLDKGQRFFVTAVDEDDATVEVQHFDGDVEEFDTSEWYQQKIEPIEQPEDWTGPVDDIERDDLGYSETDMTEEDWAEPMKEPVAEEVEAEEEEKEEGEKEE
jgi:hypothetical protein